MQNSFNSSPAPSPLAMVPFVSVAHMMQLIHAKGLANTIREIAAYIEADFARWPAFDKSPRAAAHSTDGVIELMPTSDGETYGFKYVNGHPANMARGFQTVTAFGVLSRVDTGYPVLLSEMTLLTALRTAATSALAAKHLAPPGAAVMAMIGSGAQCEFQALAFKELVGIATVRLFDVDPCAVQKAAANLEHSGLRVEACSSAQEAVLGADIITTCTADKQYATILTDNMVGGGVHINAIGGDCPGKTELHKDILLRSSIFVEYTPQTRIEGEIQQLNDEQYAERPITELWEVVSGQVSGRSSASEITLFDSVGFAIEDFSALRYVRDQLPGYPFYTQLDMLADPDDPRDLFGMVQRAGRAA